MTCVIVLRYSLSQALYFENCGESEVRKLVSLGERLNGVNQLEAELNDV